MINPNSRECDTQKSGWFTKRRVLYDRYHPTFRDFQAAIQEVLDGLSTKYSQQLASLMTLNFQQFDDVSLMAA